MNLEFEYKKIKNYADLQQKSLKELNSDEIVKIIKHNL